MLEIAPFYWLLALLLAPSFVRTEFHDPFLFALTAVAYLAMLLLTSKPVGRRTAVGIGAVAVIAALLVPGSRVVVANVGLNLLRTGTVGTNPIFVAMIRELIEERLWREADPLRRALGNRGPSHDLCPADCCRYEPRRPGATAP